MLFFPPFLTFRRIVSPPREVFTLRETGFFDLFECDRRWRDIGIEGLDAPLAVGLLITAQFWYHFSYEVGEVTAKLANTWECYVEFN